MLLNLRGEIPRELTRREHLIPALNVSNSTPWNRLLCCERLYIIFCCSVPCFNDVTCAYADTFLTTYKSAVSCSASCVSQKLNSDPPEAPCVKSYRIFSSLNLLFPPASLLSTHTPPCGALFPHLLHLHFPTLLHSRNSVGWTRDCLALILFGPALYPLWPQNAFCCESLALSLLNSLIFCDLCAPCLSVQLEARESAGLIVGGGQLAKEKHGETPTLRREREEQRRLLEDTRSAAMDLRFRLDLSERDWSREKAELMERFDVERREWESQLRDMQKKIEEVRYDRLRAWK